MSNAIVLGLQKDFDLIYDLLEKAVETCPDTLWDKKAGGFLYWQQFVHVFGVIDMFALEPDAPRSQQAFEQDVVRLLKPGSPTPDKAAVLALAKTMRKVAAAYFARMTDETLFTRNESRSQRKGYEISQLSAMTSLIGHGYFHVGACDALLRDHGAKGLM